jgi:hypothetical protein
MNRLTGCRVRFDTNLTSFIGPVSPSRAYNLAQHVASPMGPQGPQAEDVQGYELNCYEKLDAMTIYAKEENASVKKVIQSLLKIDPENHKAITP